MGNLSRVIFATTVFDEVATGPGLFAQYLWRSFREDPAVEFHLVCPCSRESHARLHVAAGPGDVYARVAQASYALARGMTLAGSGRPIVHFNAAHAAGPGLRGYDGPAIVQVNDYEVADLWASLPAAMRRGPRKVLSLLWRRGRERRAVQAATRAVCNSEYTRAAVLRAYGGDPRRTVTIHKAVDVGEFAAAAGAKPNSGAGAALRLAFIGTNWRIKGLDVLLRALALVPEAALTVAGSSDVSGNAGMIALARSLGVAGRVDFAGRLDRAELARLLAGSDAVVLPSRQEALGVSLLEALAAGVPAIASDVGGIPEIVRDGVEGLLVPPDDPTALAEAICRLARDAALRARLATAGPARAEQFSLSRMIEKYRALYRDLAS